MNTFPGLPEDRRRLICAQTAAQTGLVASSVEKDFWVTWTLEKLFSLPEWGGHLTFKGGTSLSKVWKLIERFSEDIDIVIGRDALGFGEDKAPDAAKGNERKRRMDALKAASQDCVKTQIHPLLLESFQKNLPADLNWSIKADPADNDKQTLLFTYPTVFPDHPAYLRQIVKIEMGARSDIDPAEQAGIKPIISEAFPNLFSESRVQVRAVLPIRTFWEKAMLLHEETFRTAERKTRKKYMARHYYDLYRLIKKGIADQAADDLDLFHRMVEHREVYFRYSWVDYSTLKPGSLRLVPDENQLPDWKSDYEGMQQEMFYGEVPKFDEVMDEAEKFQTRFNGNH